MPKTLIGAGRGASFALVAATLATGAAARLKGSLRRARHPEPRP
jgi:hypothetical protein